MAVNNYCLPESRRQEERIKFVARNWKVPRKDIKIVNFEDFDARKRKNKLAVF